MDTSSAKLVYIANDTKAFKIHANVDKDANKNLGSSHKYSKQTNCLTGQGNVIQDNIIISY